MCNVYNKRNDERTFALDGYDKGAVELSSHGVAIVIGRVGGHKAYCFYFSSPIARQKV